MTDSAEQPVPPDVVRRVAAEDFAWDDSPAGAALRDVVAAATAADGRSPLNEAAELSLRRHGLAAGMLLLATRGRGFAYVHGPAGGRSELELCVHPDHRGQGLGAALARMARGATGGVPLAAWSHGNHPAAAALATTLGFAAVRELRLLRWEAEPVAAPEPPDGVALRTFEPGADDEALLAVNAAAFADHPEQGDLTAADLAERMAEPWFDPAGLLLAVPVDDAEPGGAVLGFHWTKVHDDRTGEVYVLGIAPGQQGRGLGRLLLEAGLSHLAEQVAEVILYVEADNEPALRLYDARGFTHSPADTDVLYVTA